MKDIWKKMKTELRILLKLKDNKTPDLKIEKLSVTSK